MSNVWNEPYHISIEIKNERCKVLRELQKRNINRFRVADIRGISGGAVRHLVELTPEQAAKVSKNMLVKLHESNKSKGKTIAWIESEGCDVCNTIISHGSFLITGKNIQNSTFIYNFIVPNFDAYTGIITALERCGLKPKILRITKFKPKGKILTENQEKVLWLAYKMGFFDYPRKINTIKLAKRLGISPSTLSEIIRRGLRRMLRSYFETAK